MSLHAKFQPSSFKAVGGDSRDRHTHTLLDLIPKRYDGVLPYASLPYADSPQSIPHSQFAICASSPYDE